MTQEFYIERMDGKSFNLWEKDGVRYYNIATLFYNDPICENEWTIDDKSKAVSYGTNEIVDEVENPLKQIPTERAQQLLKLTSPEEVVKSLEGLL